MKKEWFVLFLLALLIMPFVYAEDAQQTEEQDFDQSLTDARKATLKALEERTNKVAEKPIDLPKFLEPVVKTLIRLEEPITLSNLIIATALFVLFAIIFIDIMRLFSPFSQLTSSVVGLILTVILSAIGVIKSLTEILIEKGNPLKFIAGWSAGALFFWFIIIIAAIILVRYWSQFLQQRKLLKEARTQGIQSASVLTLAKAFMRTMTSAFK